MDHFHPYIAQGESTQFRLWTEFPSALTVNVGTLNAGVVADVADIGGNVVDVSEVAAAPASDIVFDWAGVIGIPRCFRLIGYYQGGANHMPEAQGYDYVAADWKTLEVFEDMAGLRSLAFPSNGKFVSAGAMSLRFYHTATGNITHKMVIDYLAAEMWRE